MNSEPRIVGLPGYLATIGLDTPLKRAFVAGGLVGMGAYALRVPRATFDEEDRMRPFKLVSKAPTATYTHFLVVPLTAAILASVFI